MNLNKPLMDEENKYFMFVMALFGMFEIGRLIYMLINTP